MNASQKLIFLSTLLLFIIFFIYSFFLISPLPQNETKIREKLGEILNQKDLERCKEIHNSLYQKVCINNIALTLAQETQNISYCEMLDGELIPKEECERIVIFNKSLSLEDINVCKETQNPKLQSACKETFWAVMAIKKRNSSYCENLPENKKILCYDRYTFQEFISNPKNFECKKFQDEQTQQDCEVYKKDLPHIIKCQLLKTNMFKDYCKSMV